MWPSRWNQPHFSRWDTPISMFHFWVRQSKFLHGICLFWPQNFSFSWTKEKLTKMGQMKCVGTGTPSYHQEPEVWKNGLFFCFLIPKKAIHSYSLDAAISRYHLTSCSLKQYISELTKPQNNFSEKRPFEVHLECQRITSKTWVPLGESCEITGKVNEGTHADYSMWMTANYVVLVRIQVSGRKESDWKVVFKVPQNAGLPDSFTPSSTSTRGSNHSNIVEHPCYVSNCDEVIFAKEQQVEQEQRTANRKNSENTQQKDNWERLESSFQWYLQGSKLNAQNVRHRSRHFLLLTTHVCINLHSIFRAKYCTNCW